MRISFPPGFRRSTIPPPESPAPSRSDAAGRPADRRALPPTGSNPRRRSLAATPTPCFRLEGSAADSAVLSHFCFRSIVRFLSISTMSSSIVSPSISLRRVSVNCSESLMGLNCSSSVAFRNGIRRVGPKNLGKSKVFMSVSVGSRNAVADDLFIDYKPSCAFLFPGQGAQAVGMAAEAKNVPAAAALFEKANDILGFDLLDVCNNGPKEKLDSTVLSQPGIYVTSLAAVEILRAREGGQQIIDSVDVTCGLSLGEYTALAFAGAYSFEDGLRLVKLRSEAMQDASDAANGAMLSVIGLDAEKVQSLCDAANEEVEESEKVQIANFLCPGNYAVSGGVKGIEAVEAKAKSFKARMTVRLAVAGAFHTRFMEPAVSRLEAALAATEIRKPRIPVISNVDAQPHADPDTIRKILARQATSPVQWETTLKTLLNKGLKKSYELGPGKVIAGIMKRIDKKAELENISA